VLIDSQSLRKKVEWKQIENIKYKKRKKKNCHTVKLSDCQIAKLLKRRKYAQTL